jgi:hypothetical protein
MGEGQREGNNSFRLLQTVISWLRKLLADYDPAPFPIAGNTMHDPDMFVQPENAIFAEYCG